MSDIPSIEGLSLEGRKVLVRLDLNVPLEDGEITSDARIRAALPTIRYALDAGAHVALCSHLGRPGGQRVDALSLEPVGARLSELLELEVRLTDECIGDGVRTLMGTLRSDAVVLLENLRFDPGEKKNLAEFARQLAEPFDAYVNDAFGASHRAHASIVGVVPYVEDAVAGFLLQREIDALTTVREGNAKPFVAVVGGAKVADKLGVLQALLDRVSTLCIGGAMAYTFLRARDQEVGDSRVERDKIRLARDILDGAAAREVRIVLPVDHVVADRFAEDAPANIIGEPAIPAGKMGLDIGPETRARIAEYVRGAELVFWNGPMGVFEWEAFAEGTWAVARAAAECDGYTVVGGGDSVAAIEAAGVADRIDHISTGGGASLELLEKGTLPGLDALRNKR